LAGGAVFLSIKMQRGERNGRLTPDEADALKILENGRCGVNETADWLPMKPTRCKFWETAVVG
jgi:hypothetical protein